MAFPTVVLNNNTGSDTLASGSAPATAKTGTLAATHSNTTVNITDAVDLSTIPTDGSAVLWTVTSAGRRWSAITAISGSSGAWVVTVGVAYTVTDAADNWAIGGKRQTIGGSLQLFKDLAAGWTVDLQTNDSVTADIVVVTTLVTGSPTVIKSSTFTTWGTQPTITTATIGVCGLEVSGASGLTVDGLAFRCLVAAGSVTDGNSGIVAKTAHPSYIGVKNCIFLNWKWGINNNNGTFNGIHGLTIDTCEVANSVSHGMDLVYNEATTVSNCKITGNGGAGITLPSFGFSQAPVTGCVLASNGGAGIFGGGAITIVHNCTFDSNGTTPATTSGGLNGSAQIINLVAVNCIFWNNNGLSQGASGINSSVINTITLINCAFGGPNQTFKVAFGSTNEQIQNCDATGTVTLTANPFTSSTDWSLNNTAGGGKLCRNAGAAVPNASATVKAPDVGAIQTSAPVVSTAGTAGGGGHMHYPAFAARNIRGSDKARRR